MMRKKYIVSLCMSFILLSVSGIDAHEDFLPRIKNGILSQVTNTVKSFSTAAQVVKLNAYYWWNASRLGYSYQECLTLNTNILPEVTRKAIEKVAGRFSDEFIHSIKFVFCDYHHPLGTPALATYNRVFLYKSFFYYTYDEQVNILGHELIHLRDRHEQKLRMLVIGLLAVSCAYNYYCLPKIENVIYNTLTFKYIVPNLVILGIIRRFVNACERSADTESVRALGSATGLISCFEKWKKEWQDCGVESNPSPFQDWFGTHPSLQTRINYLVQLEHELKLSGSGNAIQATA